MTYFPPAFRELLKSTTNHDASFSPIELHGFLTGIVIGPDEIDDDLTRKVVYGFISPDQKVDDAELNELIWDAADEITEDLIDASYRLKFLKEQASKEKFGLWIQGFNKAVSLNETGWQDLHDEHLETSRKYAYLQSLADPEVAEAWFDVAPEEYTSYQAEALPLVSETVIALYHEYWMDSPQHIYPDLTIDDLPSFSPEALTHQTDDELFNTILSYADLLPRSVVEEAIRRGRPMAERLRRHLEETANWTSDAPENRWWGLLHSIFILGFITGDDANQGLLHAIRQTSDLDNIELWDRVSGYWPILFRNKRSATSAALQEIAFDQGNSWHPRVTALECLLEAAQAQGPESLDLILHRIARSVEDASEDWDYRITASYILLNFPRDDHKPILDRLVEIQAQQDDILYYDQSDVEEAYRLREDKADWDRYSDPLSFYDPENILSRQITRLDDDALEDDSQFEEPFEQSDYDEPPPVATYYRETPKVGRNDLCPCGSGKKYKKCCLKKLH